MLYSVRCGLTAVPEQSEAVLVALGDQPGITAGVVAELIASFHATGRAIVVPTYKGRRGHPLLFATHYRSEILTRYEGRGLRGFKTFGSRSEPRLFLPKQHYDTV